jgi:hypothetical protein
MSTVDRPEPRVLPPLIAGQRLDQPTFHDRYEAMPPDTRAELIGGVVHMPSPLRDGHGESDKNISYWLGHYKRFTSGVRSPNNATVKLGRFDEPQPDSQLRIPAELGGQSKVDEDDYLTGAPELIVEIGHSSRPTDLGPKAAEPQRRGIERGRHWISSRRKVAFRSAKGRSYNQARTGRETIDRHLTAEDHELGLNAKQPLPPRKTPFFRGAKDDDVATDPTWQSRNEFISEQRLYKMRARCGEVTIKDSKCRPGDAGAREVC